MTPVLYLLCCPFSVLSIRKKLDVKIKHSVCSYLHFYQISNISISQYSFFWESTILSHNKVWALMHEALWCLWCCNWLLRFLYATLIRFEKSWSCQETFASHRALNKETVFLLVILETDACPYQSMCKLDSSKSCSKSWFHLVHLPTLQRKLNKWWTYKK